MSIKRLLFCALFSFILTSCGGRYYERQSERNLHAVNRTVALESVGVPSYAQPSAKFMMDDLDESPKQLNYSGQSNGFSNRREKAKKAPQYEVNNLTPISAEVPIKKEIHYNAMILL